MMIDVCLQEESSEQQVEKPTNETEVEKEEEQEEEEEEDNDEEEDVQSFVTALENENDHVTDSINGLRLGHDDDGKKFRGQISNIVFDVFKGWITPSNVKTVKSRAFDNGATDNSDTIDETLPVACITTDFSMQVCDII